MNILALDFGLKRIGVAVGSTESGIAFPRDVLSNDGEMLPKVERLLREEKIEKIIVGKPFKRDGGAGDIEESLQIFLESLKLFQIPLEAMDERYTSKIAQAKLHDIGMKVKDQKAVSDSTAAQFILQEWLDMNR